MRTSHSALETFAQCPQKYKFQYIDKIKAPKRREAVFGTIIHETLKFMFSRGPLFPTLDEVIAHFRERWTAQEKLEISEEERGLYLKEGERMLKRFYEKNPPWNFNVVDLESRFEVVVEDPITKEVHILAGIMDRIDKTDDQTYEIIDYKTTRRIASQEAVDENQQLSLYHLGLTKRWPHIRPENIRLSLLYLKHNEKMTTVRDTASAERVKERLLETIRGIRVREASDDFPPTPSALCDYCPFKSICPSWRHLFRKKEEETVEDRQAQEAAEEFFKVRAEEEKNKKRITELQEVIRRYLEQRKLERIFSDQGYISKKIQERYAYDFEQVRAHLKKANRMDIWEALLAPTDKKLQPLLKTLPAPLRAGIEAARKLTKRYTILTASTKKVKRPTEE